MALASLSALTSLAACGASEEDRAQDAVERYFGAIVDGDAEAACDGLSERARRAFERRGGCGSALGRVLDQPGARALKRSFDRVEVQGAALDGDAGTVTIRGDAGAVRIPVRREDGDWKVAQLPRSRR